MKTENLTRLFGFLPSRFLSSLPSRFPAFPLPRLQQRRERGSLLPQIVQERSQISAWGGQDRQAISGSELCYDKECSLVLQQRIAQGSACRTLAQPVGMVNYRRGECCQRLGVERAGRRMLDGQAISAQHHNGLYRIPGRQIADNASETSH
jgi:hypothetical protein